LDILVVGSVALDSVQTPMGKKDDVLGGSAVYSSYSASFFTKVKFVGTVGEDFPNRFLNIVKARPICLKGLQCVKGKTFRWKGKYEDDMNCARTISTHLNVFSRFDPVLPKEYKKAKCVFMANIDPEIQQNVLRQVDSPELVALDTMNFWIESKKKELLKALKKTNIFILNDAEARQLSGYSNLIKAATAILKMGPETVVIKKGEHGSLLAGDSQFFTAPAYPLKSVYDPTGAGDVFAGGFLGHLARSGNMTGDKLRQAVIYGSVMASFNVESFSLNRLRRLKPQEINSRYKEFQKMTQF